MPLDDVLDKAVAIVQAFVTEHPGEPDLAVLAQQFEEKAEALGKRLTGLDAAVSRNEAELSSLIKDISRCLELHSFVSDEHPQKATLVKASERLDTESERKDASNQLASLTTRSAVLGVAGRCVELLSLLTKPIKAAEINEAIESLTKSNNATVMSLKTSVKTWFGEVDKWHDLLVDTLALEIQVPLTDRSKCLSTAVQIKNKCLDPLSSFLATVNTSTWNQFTTDLQSVNSDLQQLKTDLEGLIESLKAFNAILGVLTRIVTFFVPV